MGEMTFEEFNSFFYNQKNKTEIFDLIDMVQINYLDQFF